MKPESITLQILTLVLRAGLLVTLLAAGWLIYIKMPHRQVPNTRNTKGETTVQIVLEQSSEMQGLPLNIPVEIYPVDIVAVRHEYFTERRTSKRWDEFLNERMNGRRPISIQLDKQGQASVLVARGAWWIHAMLAGDEDLEWRLPISVGEEKQTIQLTAQNVYARSRSF